MPRANQRSHALDHLRAFAMFLGILFHAAIPYLFLPSPAWPVRDPSVSIGANILVFALHGFRMQLFFVMSGYFACLVYERKGLREFVSHRFRRIVIPFLGALLLIQPLLQLIALPQERWILATHPAAYFDGSIPFQFTILDPAQAPPTISEHFASLRFLAYLMPVHLWFLYYLCFLYAGALLIAKPLRRLGDIEIFLPMPVLALLLLPALYTFRSWTVSSTLGWAPVPGCLAYYSVFFFLGWLFYGREEWMARASRRWRAWLALAFLVFLPGSLALTAKGLPLELHGGSVPEIKLAALVLQALYTWCMVFGFMGLFFEKFAKPGRATSYLADSSYWCYLASIPVILVFQIAAAETSLAWWLKLPLVTVGSFGVLLASYELCIRYSFVGTILHGERKRSPSPEDEARFPSPEGEASFKSSESPQLASASMPGKPARIRSAPLPR